MSAVVTVLWIIGVVCWVLGALKIPVAVDFLQLGLAFFGAGLVVARL